MLFIVAIAGSALGFASMVNNHYEFEKRAVAWRALRRGDPPLPDLLPNTVWYTLLALFWSWGHWKRWRAFAAAEALKSRNDIE